MANRLILIHVLSMLLATTGCLAKVPFLKTCDADSSLSVFLKEDSEWQVVREPGAFSPILDLVVFESEFWIRTYRADPFPVKAKPLDNSILIENIRFLRPLPAKIDNDPAELVRQYTTEEIVFAIPLDPNHCDIQDKLQIDITNLIGGKKETITFIRL